MTKQRPLDDLGPLYHHYGFFGVDNQQVPGIYAPNQAAKEPILRAYIALAFAKLESFDSRRSDFVELFCADGYYAMLATKFGAKRAVGVDNGRDDFFTKARQIARALNIQGVEFVQKDVHEAEALGQFDVVANVGGLYHVSDPQAVLDISYRMARRYLIVQTVVSLESDKQDYFVMPAPGQDWGCRLSVQSFDRLLVERGWNVLDRHFNHLTGNPRLSDRGSVYYLIAK